MASNKQIQAAAEASNNTSAHMAAVRARSSRSSHQFGSWWTLRYPARGR